MPGSRRISNEVMRLLYAHSGNRCAYPDCTNPIFEDDGQLTGECCHIKMQYLQLAVKLLEELSRTRGIFITRGTAR